jgi:hypothetical protein
MGVVFWRPCTRALGGEERGEDGGTSGIGEGLRRETGFLFGVEVCSCEFGNEGGKKDWTLDYVVIGVGIIV